MISDQNQLFHLQTAVTKGFNEQLYMIVSFMQKDVGCNQV